MTISPMFIVGLIDKNLIKKIISDNLFYQNVKKMFKALFFN